MITPLGKELRYIRLENNELLKNMAEKLNITSAYLSSIEHGKVKVTKKFVKNVINKYSLDNEHKERFVNIFMSVQK